MSSSKLPCSTRGSISTHNRPLANFPPDVWGDIFLHPSKMYVDGETQLQHEELKEEVRRMIRVDVGDDLLHKLRLIDTVKRLGVSYHFEREIKEALHCVHEHPYQYDQTLEATSLRFRLLRESGFNASCETFNKFKDDEGSFSKSLTSDVKGLLELYEAAHLLVHGEHILQEALAFTTTHLELAKATGIVEYPLSALVSNALYLPLRKALPRLEARRYISIYQEDASHDKTLLKFAELDFNLLQNLHKEELCKLSRWWKDLDFASKLPFARDRMVELYFWMLGMYFEPIYSFAREILTKVVSLISIMDDIYDSYGTFEELQLFRDAIQRWNDDCVDRLPDYMKLFYNLLLNIYKEIEEAMTKQGQPYRVQHSINKFKQLSDSYFAEAKWYNENHVPTMEEYMRVSLKSAATAPIIVTSLVGMENELTPEIFNWASDDPKIIVACAIQGRLEDDIASHKFEQERGHCASAVECYMREHGVSEEKACIELKKQVDNAWKDINYEMIFSETSKVVPVSVLTRVLNLTRATEFMYLAGDGYTHVGKSTKDGITSLLIDPISVSASGN
ncbi:(+)-delta-cadinene synthase isozyme XC14-like [Hibiscus syriacus]|uniref:(+)-delta-cadinene synthase isozyme XC14-like n=1 Tax=Hibiscus syriacus TaxID=106335 RepID=UPI001922F060|nr:(+)-delta-cadinene synthase isozyme XC14-like [Hibiscus syriacus]